MIEQRVSKFDSFIRLGITTLDLGDVYLTVIYFQNFTPSLRRIDFKEFWEVKPFVKIF